MFNKLVVCLVFLTVLVSLARVATPENEINASSLPGAASDISGLTTNGVIPNSFSASSTNLTADVVSAVVSQTVTFTAMVDGTPINIGIPTGNVTFKDGPTAIGTANLDFAGQATFTWSLFSAGIHSISSVYSGDFLYDPSTSSNLTLQIDKATTDNFLFSAPNPSTSGQPVTLIANPFPSPGVSVIAEYPPDNSDNVAINSSIIAIFSKPLNPASINTTTFILKSDNSTVAGAVNYSEPNRTAIFTSSANLTSNTTFSATITTGVTDLTGVALSGNFTWNLTTGNDSDTTGPMVVFVLPANNAINVSTLTSPVALFSEALNPLTVNPSTFTLTHGSQPTSDNATARTIVTTAILTPSTTLSTNTTYTATITNGVKDLAGNALSGNFSWSFTTATSSGGGGGGGGAPDWIIPTGNVTFKDGSTILATVSLNSTGQATFNTSSLSAGNHNITAVYSGDSNYIGSTSVVVIQTIQGSNIASATVTLTSSANPTVLGQAVTFTANVTAIPPAGGIPTGNVTFMDGATALGTRTISGSGQATLSTSALAAGSHNITAAYAGDITFAGSTSSVLSQVVNMGTSTTSIVSSLNPSVFGQPVSFTANVTAVPPASGTPTGTVTFKDGTAELGTVTVNGSGQASYSTTALAAGSHNITAAYAGDFSSSSSSVLGQIVNPGGSTTSILSSANPSVFGQTVTFTANITALAPANGTPTGTVTFKDGTTTLGTGTVDDTGHASYSTTALAAGSHGITAVYAGSSNFNSSTSSILSQSVNQGAVTTSILSSVNPSTFGQSVTFTANVTAVSPTSGIPTGNVTFKDGATTLGTGTINGSGQATFSTSALVTGNHSITAAYAGDSNFNASTSSILNQNVNQGASTTSIMSSANPSVEGQGVTFTANVTAVLPASGIPTGNVTFMDGSTTLGIGIINGSGQATYATSALSLGSHSIAAVYPGDNNFSSSSSSGLVQTVLINTGTNVNLTVVLQGSARPAAGWVVPLTLKLFTSNATVPVDVMTANPVYTFSLTTAKSGSTATGQVTGITPGTYDITAVTPSSLINVKRNVVIVSPSTDVNMGSLLEGNANDNNIINILDFGILAAAYGKSSGTSGYDIRADFDRNGIINIFDFGLLAANYSKASPVVVP